PPAAFYRKYTVPHMSGKAGPPTGNGLRQPHRRLGTGLWTRVDPATGRAAWPRAVQPGRGPYSLATSRTAWPRAVQPGHGPYSLTMGRTAWPWTVQPGPAEHCGHGPCGPAAGRAAAERHLEHYSVGEQRPRQSRADASGAKGTPHQNPCGGGRWWLAGWSPTALAPRHKAASRTVELCVLESLFVHVGHLFPLAVSPMARLSRFVVTKVQS